jgi:hypothetical protein
MRLPGLQMPQHIVMYMQKIEHEFAKNRNTFHNIQNCLKSHTLDFSNGLASKARWCLPSQDRAASSQFRMFPCLESSPRSSVAIKKRMFANSHLGHDNGLCLDLVI